MWPIIRGLVILRERWRFFGDLDRVPVPNQPLHWLMGHYEVRINACYGFASFGWRGTRWSRRRPSVSLGQPPRFMLRRHADRESVRVG